MATKVVPTWGLELCTGFLHDIIHLNKVGQSFLTKETRLEPTHTGLKFKVLTAQPPCKPPHEMGRGGGRGEGLKEKTCIFFEKIIFYSGTSIK